MRVLSETTVAEDRPAIYDDVMRDSRVNHLRDELTEDTIRLLTMYHRLQVQLGGQSSVGSLEGWRSASSLQQFAPSEDWSIVLQDGSASTLRQISEIEEHLRSQGSESGKKLLENARDAAAFMEFWPSDLPEPDADLLDAEGVLLECYRDNGTILASFDFCESGRVFYTILNGQLVVESSDAALLDRVRLKAISRVVRGSLSEA
ncbi:hypothetical protein P2H44_22695 [Albimonas sp. CAU 1670]|uniref:hypothetical protein n=1 Tax=Albimonas sp. CAU 1670 TaxID=3032599 RepID=UPI0023D9D679|nr:hypothetical protein [Albimonas sp. CAU 1670]MDF2235374.1 hypothetical protein [Albimonas sp. CAU 1670]